ncbi:thioredoxin-like protein [Mycotypha africana]|uniref:thioredoxin-like protein n=1 Tax=Mycotypha africana TaxID=64632 RepID=UPI00230015EB|nr:thioredoxin-like protein [Mycotypha africana]KAI8967043.1 thioredoxin-like protein [Mycotypha africana]
MKLFSIASAVTVSCLSSIVYAISIELKPDTLEEVIGPGTWLIEYFSPYCPHCQHFAPEWERFTNDYSYLADEKNFHFGTIDCSTYGDLCRAHGIAGVPSIQLWEFGKKIEKYIQGNTYDGLVNYVKDKLKLGDETETEKAQETVATNSNLNVTHDDKDISEKDTGKDKAPKVESIQSMVIEDDLVETGLEMQEDDNKIHEQQQPKEAGLIEEIAEEAKSNDAALKLLANPDGVSVELDGDKLKEISSSNTNPWFVKFYAPWCPHCKRMAPTWTKMAEELRGQMNVGEVNCDKAPTLCDDYDITGFPTLQILGLGDVIHYNGDRSLVSLTKFANEHTGVSVKDISMDELEGLLSLKDTVLIYLKKDDKDTVPEMIDSIGRQYMATIPFYASHDELVIDKFNAKSKLPALLIAKDGMFSMYSKHDFSNLDDKPALLRWIENVKYPLVSKLGPTNYKSILEGHSPVVLNIINAKDTTSQSKFRDIASNWKVANEGGNVSRRVIFAEMDRAMWREYVLEKFNVEHDSTSKLIIFNAPEHIYFDKDTNKRPLSIDQPEELYTTLKNLDKLQGETTLAVHEQIGDSLTRGVRWIFTHWFISSITLGVVGSFVYRYLTYHSPKRLNNAYINANSGLPYYKPSSYTHKD